MSTALPSPIAHRHQAYSARFSDSSRNRSLIGGFVGMLGGAVALSMMVWGLVGFTLGTSEARAEGESLEAIAAAAGEGDSKTTNRQWPVYRGDDFGTGVSSEPLPAELDVAWRFTQDLGPIDATPVVQNDVVYIGDADGNIIALNLLDGSLKWRIKYEAGFIASGAVREGVLYIGDFDGIFRAIDTTDGKLKWEFTTEGEIDSGASFYKDLVLITSQDGSLYALEQASGKLRWKYETTDQLRCTPTVVGNRTFLGGCDGKLHAVDLDKGAAAGPLLPLGNPTGSTPSISGSVAFVPTYGGQVFAFLWEESKEKWVFSDPKLSQEIAVSAAVKDDFVVVVSKNRRVIALDKESGSVRWQVPLKKRADAAPVISDNRVWIACTDGRLYAFDLQSGSEVWSYEVGGQLRGSPAIASGKMLLGTDKDGVICFAAKK